MTHITKGIETLKILDPKSNLTSTIQNNININTEQIKPNENIEQDNPYSTNNLNNEQFNNLQDIKYNSSNEIINELNFLRKVLDIYMSQTLVFKNKKILCTGEELIDLIKTITNAENIELETSVLDSSCGCINTSEIPILDVDKIWILSNNERKIFKYSYPQAISLFERCNISLKYIKC